MTPDVGKLYRETIELKFRRRLRSDFRSCSSKITGVIEEDSMSLTVTLCMRESLSSSHMFW